MCPSTAAVLSPVSAFLEILATGEESESADAGVTLIRRGFFPIDRRFLIRSIIRGVFFRKVWSDLSTTRHV